MLGEVLQVALGLKFIYFSQRKDEVIKSLKEFKRKWKKSEPLAFQIIRLL